MKTIHYIKLLFSAYLVAFSVACSSEEPKMAQENNLEVFNNVKSELSFRPWETEGLGKVIGKETITVIKTKDGKGDVVVLRWSEDKSQFLTEVYRGDPEATDHTSWGIINSTEKKTLTFQHGDLYMIHQLVAGKAGGQKSEVFKLKRN